MNTKEMFNQLINHINKHLENYLKESYKLPYKDIEKLNSINELTISYALRKGKRLRPLLFILTATLYKCDSKITFDDRIIKDSIFLEILQAFFLCHDDIIDDSELRRGEKSLHVLLDGIVQRKIEFKDNKNFYNGKMFSIISGDYLFSLACKAVHSINFPDKLIKDRFINSYYDYVLDTITGQNIDMLQSYENIEDVDIDNIKKMYSLKTAKYTIECPMVLGAIYSGIQDESEINNIKKYAMNIGIAFQIQDDIIGIFGDEKRIGKSIKSDIIEEKKTLLIKYTLEYLSKKDGILFKDLFNEKLLTNNDFNKIKKIIYRTGALEKCVSDIENLLKKSLIIIDKLNLQNESKLIIENFTYSILNKYNKIN